MILSHVNPNRVATLKALLKFAPYVTVVCSKPAAIALRTAFADSSSLPAAREEEAIDLGIEYAADQVLKVHVVRDEETLDLGHGHELQFFFVPTPRHPDALCTYDPATRILFTDKLFGAHVCDEPVLDENWRKLDDDRRYYFDCLHAAQARQVEAALEKITPLAPKIYAPGHGPMVRYSLSRFTLDYRQWSQQQGTKDLNVALLYASAYGNTTSLANAIAAGITHAGAAVEAINCEFTDPADITRAIEACDGFLIGSPTLAGHPPTQIQTALGIVLSTAAKTKVAGVFGSFGWSGEAVDQLEGKLQDAGYRFGFEPIRVKFKPTEETLQQCEAAGAEFVQALKKARRVRAPRQMAAEAQTDRTGQAVGRVTGSLCVLTGQQDGNPFGLLTSWISQASFSPPGVTIAIAKEGAAEVLARPGEQFVLNILKEGRTLRRYFLKPVSGAAGFADVETQPAANGCLALSEALAYLECTVQNRMDCGDHWLIYAAIGNGKVLDPTGVTAVNHRKSGSQH